MKNFAAFHFIKNTTSYTTLVLALTSQNLYAAETLDDSANIVEEVIVIGKESSAATEMTVETRQLLNVAGAANDPLQAIFSLPGVTFSTSDGPGGNDPVIRGSAPQDNAYFIDLIPARYIFHLFGNSIFDEHTINSFDLYPAAFSNKYGNATGGIIDVTLRDPKNQDFTTTMHTSILSAGVIVESGLSENQAFYASFRRSMMDLLIDEDTINDETEDEGFKIDKLPISEDYQVKYNWDVNANNRLSIVATGAADTIAATFSENNQEVARDPDFKGPASIVKNFDSQGITWEWQEEDQQLTSIFSHISESDNLIYGKAQHEKTEANRYLSRFFYTQDLNNQHTLTTGLSLGDISYDLDFNAKLVSCTNLDPECSTVDAEYVVYNDTLKLFTYEFFLEDKWSINDNNILNYGFHYSEDDYLKDGRVEPRLKWEYKISDVFSTYLAAGQYSQLPQLREMIEVLGNPNLKVIKADHYVWGITQSFGNSWRWGTDIYYKNMTDIVISSEQDSSAENYSNSAKGSAYGIEFLINKDLTDRWNGWASLSLANTDRTNNNTGQTVQFEYDKPVLFNLVANRLIGERWMLGFKWNYQSGGRYTPVVDLAPTARDPNVLEPVYGELNSQQYPDYHRLDIRAEYTSPKNWGYWKFYVDILNAYNRKNVESYEYAPNGKDLISTPAGYGSNVPVTQKTGEGLFPSLGIEIQF